MNGQREVQNSQTEQNLKSRIDRVEQLRVQIKEKLDQAKEIEIAIKALVRQNLYTQASPEGILTRDPKTVVPKIRLRGALIALHFVIY